MDNFCHLHVHSHYSLLDGKGKPAEYAERAKALGQPALAITDHGSLSGAYSHWKECNRVGIKPIIGCEFYVAPTSRYDKTPVAGFGGSGKHAHLTVLAASSTGLRNLFKLQARAYSEGLYGRPRIDFELIEEHREGLLVLSGCAGGHISKYLRDGDIESADALATRLRDSFPGRFFIEVMYHDIKADDLDETLLNNKLIELANRVGVQLVATNDAHYCLEEDSVVHDALLCIQTKSLLSSEKRFRFDGHGYHIRSRAEMEATGLPSEALDNTVAIAEMIDSYDEVFAHALRMPKFSDDEGYDLECTAMVGIGNRLDVSSLAVDDPYVLRLTYELDVITSMGYAGYFLVLEHIIREAKKCGIVIGPGRGSAGGSLVAYALGITDLDPLVHGLLFERFLNPSRSSLPDIDIDVAEHHRPSLIELVNELYGAEYVATIGTFGTIGAKAALKDANRVLGGDFGAGSEYVRNLPPAKFGRSPGLDQYTGPKDEVFALASGLEGLIRNQGQHAAGVIISPDPLADLIPLWRPADQEQLVCGFDMHELENLGLVKMDFLGLRNLGVIDDCLRMVSERALRPALPIVPEECNDRKTYDLLSRGDSLGVFQLDSPGMRGLLRLLKPKRFDDISAVLALYRPGPMGANAHVEFAHRANRPGGWQSEWAIHPDLEEALKPVVETTYGLIVFQEQVLAALNVVCGWSYAEAGLLFDAMRKKKTEKMMQTKPSYLAAGEAKGFSSDALEALWDVLVPFSDYSFNRAHTAGYGLIAYWTAYLKANYPAEYMAALLSSVSDDPDRLSEYLGECSRLGIKVLPPDVNISKQGFTPDGKDIRYGISAIKGVGEKAYSAIESCRPYGSLRDFLSRVPSNALNSGVVGALVASGCLDSLVPNREGLGSLVDEFVELEQIRRAALVESQPLLIPAVYSVPDLPVDKSQRRTQELETLGVVVTQAGLTIRPTAQLSEAEIEFIKKVVYQNPGMAKVSLDLKFMKVSIGTASLTPELRRGIGSLGSVEIYEE